MEQMLLVIGLAAVCILALKGPKLLRSREPAKTAPAEVVTRRCVMPDGSYSNFRGSKMEYYVAFLVDDHPLELSVTSTQYTQLLEGTRGTLTWQGTTLTDFH